MPFLLRVELPDVPGSLGRLASAIGEAGGDIDAIEIVEKRHDGTAVDDVLLEIAPGTMPDSIVSACNALDGVRVLWISRYAAGGNVFLDLEAVEDLTARPRSRRATGWSTCCPRSSAPTGAPASARTPASCTRPAAPPSTCPGPRSTAPDRLEVDDEVNLFAAARLDDDEIVVIGRRGGPEFLDSELARLGHLAGLAMSITRAAATTD